VITWVLGELDEISYNSEYIIFHHLNQLKFDYIVSEQIEILKRNVNGNATAQLIRDIDDLNIIDINKWFENIVFKVNFTDNKTDIIEWIELCMDKFVLSYLNSKIRLRTQYIATEWAKWDPMVTHSYYLNEIIIKQESSRENYKYVVRATCSKHISESICQLKTLRMHISCVDSESKWLPLMEQHESECYIIKQAQENDRLRLLKAFELDRFIEITKIEYVLRLIRLLQIEGKTNYDREINNCMYGLCIADTYRAIIDLDTD